MDTPNNRLDDRIAIALETETVVTSLQKKRAWENLQAKAAHQVQLAPYAIPPRRSVPRPGKLEIGLLFLSRCLSFLLTDEAGYQRAATNRYFSDGYYFITLIGSEQVIHCHSTSCLRFKII
jgi:hypothetical protein